MALTEEELDMMINWDTSSLGRLFEQPAMNNNSDSSSSGQLGFRFQHHEPTAIQSPPLQTLIPPLETGTSSRGAPTQASSTNLSRPIVPLWIQHEQLRERALNLIQLRNSMFNRDTSSLGLFEQPAMNNNSDSTSSGQSGFQHHEPTAIQSPPLQTQIPPLETGTSSRGAPTQACSTNLSGPIVPLWIQHEQLRERALNLIQLRNSMIRRRRIHTRHGLTEADFAGLKEDKISKYLKIIMHNNIDDEKTVCAICLDNFCGKDMQVAIVDGCGHKFHACCLKRWLQRKNICPLCRRIAIRFL